MATEERLSIEQWCKNCGFDEHVTKLKDELEFEAVNDLFYLKESELDEVCAELGLKFGKKSKFLQALKQAKENIEGNNENEEKKQNVASKQPVKRSKTKVSLIFVGETGVGKSTLLESLRDFINGRTFEDIKATPKGPDGGNESVTQTTDQFTLSNDEWAINIIDTPGIGDTRGVDQDEKNMDNITDFLGDYGEFNAICILVKRGSSRLTERFEYIVNEIRANLPKDVSENFITVMTRADVAIPDKDTKAAIKKLGLPTDNIVPINNVSYEELDDAGYSANSPVIQALKAQMKGHYYTNQKYLEILLETASKMKCYQGDKIRELKIHRDKLKEEVGLLQTKIQDSFRLDEKLKEQMAEMEEAQNNKSTYQNFSRLRQWEDFEYIKETGKISTMCTSCNPTRMCHIDCGLSYGEDLNGCCCAGAGGRCNECGCSMSTHTHAGWKTVIHKRKEYKEDPEAKKKWEDAVERAKMIAKSKKELQDKMAANHQSREQHATEIAKLYQKLSQMAIIGHNESAEKYMKECKKAIEGSKLTAADKKRRLGIIDQMIEKMNVLNDVINEAKQKIKNWL